MDKIVFRPAMPIPIHFDVQNRIESLRRLLDPNIPDPAAFPGFDTRPLIEQHRVNIEAIIKLYEDGIIDGTKKVYIRGGKLIPYEETLKGSQCIWEEGGLNFQMVNHIYGSGPFQPNFYKVNLFFLLIFNLTIFFFRFECYSD